METWAKKSLTRFDAIVLEMTTNTYQVHDILVDLVHSVTVVHPPHIALIAMVQVKTDQRDSLVFGPGATPAIHISRKYRCTIGLEASMPSRLSVTVIRREPKNGH